MKKQKMSNLKFWNFITNKGERSAELEIYGDIASHGWWGDEVTPSDFKVELDALGEIDMLTVRINSGGGDVFAANTIHNLLKDFNAHIMVKIDGWAASAATIVASAGDEIVIPKNGIFMIHNPLISMSGYYNKIDMEEAVKILDATKKSIIKSYAEKTGKEEEEIASLMDEETWLVGQEAVDAGFCDRLTGEEAVTNNVSVKNTMTYKHMPDKVKKLINQKRKEVTDMSNEVKNITTIDALKEAYPELTNQIIENAKQEERKRIENIENVAMSGFESIVKAAKFDKPITAEALAVEILAAQKQKGVDFIAKRDEDVNSSGMKDVKTENEATKPVNEYDAIIDKKYAEK